MKKKTIKAFTLVEMLIVIVIIGILIASLMPRMQQAQSRARDVTRKNDLSQLQTAIISYLGDTGELPKKCPLSSNVPFVEGKGCKIEYIQTALKAGGLDVLPADPIEDQDYWYYTVKRNDHDDQGFYLAANMEVAGTANFVYCKGGANEVTMTGKITDTATFVPCKNVKEVEGYNCTYIPNGECTAPAGDFWYVVTY